MLLDCIRIAVYASFLGIRVLGHGWFKFYKLREIGLHVGQFT